MLVLHLCAALLVAAWLRLGERQLFRLAAAVARRAGSALTEAVALALSTLRVGRPDLKPVATRAIRLQGAPLALPRGLLIATARAHRGPPHLAV
jgi:hypothetical protein